MKKLNKRLFLNKPSFIYDIIVIEYGLNHTEYLVITNVGFHSIKESIENTLDYFNSLITEYYPDLDYNISAKPKEYLTGLNIKIRIDFEE